MLDTTLELDTRAYSWQPSRLFGLFLVWVQGMGTVTELRKASETFRRKLFVFYETRASDLPSLGLFWF